MVFVVSCIGVVSFFFVVEMICINVILFFVLMGSLLFIVIVFCWLFLEIFGKYIVEVMEDIEK